MPSNKQKTVYLIAHHIRSLYNVGSLFRTGDGAGIDKLILSGYTGFPPREKISKVALGAEKTLAWERVKEIGPYLAKLKKQSFQIVALETGKKGVNFQKFKPKYPLALIIGNEKRGLSKGLLRKADKCVFIPMRGKKESLNVSVAAGIALYEMLRG
ncbi:MAG: TrmH family RNA methyltransferase [Patescibacteria group bacterium]